MKPPIATATDGRRSEAVARGRDGVVRLEVPADPRYLRVVRLVASACAADAGFDIDDIEDVRVAADELCAGALELEPLGTIVLTFQAVQRQFTIQSTAALGTDVPGTAGGGGGGDPPAGVPRRVAPHPPPAGSPGTPG